MKKRLPFRTSIALSSAGWLYLIVTLGIGVAGVNSGNNLLYLITAMLLSSLVLSGLLSKLTLSGLTCHLKLPEFLFAQQSSAVTLCLENRKRLFSSYSVQVVSSSPDIENVFFLSLAPHTIAEQIVQLNPQKRGRLTLFLKKRTSFPFGLIEKAIFVRKVEMTIFPPLSQTDLPLARASATALGELPTGQPGGSGDFYQLRPYQTGEDSRSIDWRFLAKWGKAFVMQGEKETAQGWVVQLVVERDALPATIEKALSLCTTLLYSRWKQGFPIGLKIGAQFFPPSRQKENLLSQLTALALFQPNSLLSEDLPTHSHYREIVVRAGKESQPHLETYAA